MIKHDTLATLNSKTLKQLALITGSAIGTTKPARIQNILRNCNIFEQLRAKQQQNNNIVVSSIDTGITNFSVCTFRWNYNAPLPTLIHWDKLHLEKRFLNSTPLTLQPLETTTLTNALTTHLLTQQQHHTDLYTIEKQRTRTIGSKGITDPIVKLNIMEHLIFNKLHENNNIVSSDPAKMTKFWLSEARLNDTQAKNSKRLRIDLVKSLIFNNNNNKQTQLFDIADPLRSMIQNYNPGKKNRSLFDALQLNEHINGPRKDDDLTDSLLHSLAWMYWLNTYTQLHDLIQQTPSTEAITQFAIDEHKIWDQKLESLY